MFVYQLIFDRLDVKKDKGTDYVLVGNQRGYILLNLSHYILFSGIV